MAKNIIEIRHLCKSYGAVRAVDDLSFSVRTGQLFTFLGVNGAGKSTTISMLCGQLKRDSGEIWVDGKELCHHSAEIARTLGVVFQNSVLDAQLTVLENLKYRAALYGIRGEAFRTRLAEVTALFQLEPLLKRQVGKLSGGQRRRIDIARAIFHQPKLLILDEPTTGLDPQTRHMVWDVIHTLRKTAGLTVFLTTHYMEETADADYVVILDGGKIAAEGTPLDLKNTYTGDFITLYGASESEVQQLGVPYCKDGITFRLTVPNTQAATKLILEHPECFRDYEITKGKMDDVFLTVTGKHAAEGER